jgi:hypothetical protein
MAGAGDGRTAFLRPHGFTGRGKAQRVVSRLFRGSIKDWEEEKQPVAVGAVENG